MDLFDNQHSPELQDATDKIDDIKQILGDSSVQEVQFHIEKVGDISFRRSSAGFEISFIAWAKGGSRAHRTGTYQVDIVSGRVETSGTWKREFSLRELIDYALNHNPSSIEHSADFLSHCSFSSEPSDLA